VLNERNEEGGIDMRLIPYTRRTEEPVLSMFDRLFTDFPFDNGTEGRSWNPSVDILEKDGHLVLRAELPGMTEKDIDLKIEGNTLVMKGEKKFENEDRKDDYHRIERCYGSFTRCFTLPDTIDHDKINAEFKNGILTVTIAQKPEAKPREIPVKVN
jgi:HSP20 family protein